MRYRAKCRAWGLSLIELLISMSIAIVIGLMAVAIFRMLGQASRETTSSYLISRDFEEAVRIRTEEKGEQPQPLESPVNPVTPVQSDQSAPVVPPALHGDVSVRPQLPGLPCHQFDQYRQRCADGPVVVALGPIDGRFAGNRRGVTE